MRKVVNNNVFLLFIWLLKSAETMKKIFFLLFSMHLSFALSGQVPDSKVFNLRNIKSESESSEKAEPMYNQLMDNYDVKFYKIDLRAGNKTTSLRGSVLITASVEAAELDTFVIELNNDYTIDSVMIDGLSLPYRFLGDEIKIVLPSSLPFGTSFTAVIYYHGTLSNDIQGIFSGISHDADYKITYTLSEPLYAKDWFPCKQVLTDKADSVYVFVTTDSALKVGSNGLLTDVVNLGDGKVRHEWKSRYPIAYYLISMTIGDFYEYNIYAHPEGLDDSILIQNYLYDKSVLKYSKMEIDTTADLIEAFSAMFGMYPFKDEKYGHCMAPIGGGMEHQTMTTIYGFDFNVVAHELAHMWFGDYVTCSTWQDIWINEGFATYCALLAEEYLSGVFPVGKMASYHTTVYGSDPEGSIFIPGSELEIDFSDEIAVYLLSSRIFDWGLSYVKGACILHMLRYELNNDELFFQVLRTFLEEYRNGNATGLDFKSVLENETGKDFTGFFDLWYFGAGFPRYTISWNQINDTVYVESVQGNSIAGSPFLKMNYDIQLRYGENDTVFRLEQTQQTQQFRLLCKHPVDYVSIDPFNWLLVQTESMTHIDIFGNAEAYSPNRFKVYPNPFNDVLHIDVDNLSESATVNLYDLMGCLIFSEPYRENFNNLPAEKLAPGLYIININTDEDQWAGKICKQ
jgi:aminopeptidase N